MAEICPVCGEELTFETWEQYKFSSESQAVPVHDFCLEKFASKPEGYFEELRKELANQEKKALEREKKAEANEKPDKEQAKQAEANFNKSIEQSKIEETSLQEIKDKSVYVKGFTMSFGGMVIFALKWMLAMIPALILFWIIIALFTALFGVSLMSIFL
mgnify:CR=1 FL=1